MIVYKLTDQNLQTYGSYQWEPGVARETDGNGGLCGPGWLHYYHDPLLAVLLNPIHADIANPILWEAEADGLHRDDRGLKGGCTRLTLIRQVDLPQITTEQRVRFGILCAKAVCNDRAWSAWADRWLDGSDRSQESAWAATEAAARAAEAAWAAAEAAAETAARAAEAAEGTPLDLIAIASAALKGDSDE